MRILYICWYNSILCICIIVHVSVFDSHSSNECKKLGLIALFLSHSNVLKWKYYTAILTAVFNSVNKFCCFFTFKVNSICCYSFSEWILFTAFLIFRIYTNDGGDDNVIWCEVCDWRKDQREAHISFHTL